MPLCNQDKDLVLQIFDDEKTTRYNTTPVLLITTLTASSLISPSLNLMVSRTAPFEPNLAVPLRRFVNKQHAPGRHEVGSIPRNVGWRWSRSSHALHVFRSHLQERCVAQDPSRKFGSPLLFSSPHLVFTYKNLLHCASQIAPYFEDKTHPADNAF